VVTTIVAINILAALSKPAMVAPREILLQCVISTLRHPMAMFPLVFAKLPVAPRVSSNCYTQMLVEANLEGFHPAPLLLPEGLEKESHGIEDGHWIKSFFLDLKASRMERMRNEPNLQDRKGEMNSQDS
jgi:hypothetical protein